MTNPTRWTRAQPWLTTVGRVGLGAVWILAGAAKVSDLAESVRAVRAYRILPEVGAQVVGSGLPMLEIALGVLLVLGLGTRTAALISLVLIIVFIGGITSAWARGLRIDCGCFGGGGDLAADANTAYGLEIIRDTALGVLAGLVTAFPRSRLAVDHLLTRTLESP